MHLSLPAGILSANMHAYMHRALISIIIPVYNAAPYLKACLDSLLAQDFTDWEAICINDGSTDESLDILHRYAARDTRFQVLTQPNSGVSVARNRGFQAAQGRYLCMVDSDDELPEHALATLAAPVLQDPELDIIVGNLLWQKEVDGGIRSTDRGPLIYGSKVTGPVSDLVLLAHQIPGLPTAKLYRKAVMDEAGLAYDTELHIGEDKELTLRYLLHAKRGYVTQDIVYHYMMRPSSTMGKFRRGELSLHDYLMLPVSSLRLAKTMPEEMPAAEKRGLAQVLAFFFLRDFLRGFIALWEPRPKVAHKLLRKALLKWIATKPHLHGASLRRAWQQMRTLEPRICTLLKNIAREKLKRCPLIIPLLYLKRMFKKR